MSLKNSREEKQARRERKIRNRDGYPSFYRKTSNVSAAGIGYTGLTKADKSGGPSMFNHNGSHSIDQRTRLERIYA